MQKITRGISEQNVREVSGDITEGINRKFRLRNSLDKSPEKLLEEFQQKSFKESQKYILKFPEFSTGIYGDIWRVPVEIPRQSPVGVSERIPRKTFGAITRGNILREISEGDFYY